MITDRRIRLRAVFELVRDVPFDGRKDNLSSLPGTKKKLFPCIVFAAASTVILDVFQHIQADNSMKRMMRCVADVRPRHVLAMPGAARSQSTNFTTPSSYAVRG